MTRIGRFVLLFALAAPVVAPAAVTIDAAGWTRITPSADSRLVYVSSSEGDDVNDGLSPQSPKRSIAAGDALIRDGYPDHLLLKRGDTFVATETEDRVLRRWKNGRSADEPIVLSSYGTSGARPVIAVRTSLIDHDGQARHFQAFIGIDVYRRASDPDSPDFTSSSSTTAMRFVGGGNNLIIEDCRFRYCSITLQSFGDHVYRDPSFRRNIVFGAWRHNTYNSNAGIQGMFVSGVADSYVFEENFFDHNGWSQVVPGAGANQFNHNLYVQYSNVAGGVFRGNIFARAAAHGLQARSGGVIERNLFVLNAIGFNFGGVSPPTDPDVMTFDNRGVQNVVLNGRLMDPANYDYPRTRAVWGIPVAFVGEVDLVDNIVASRVDSGSNDAFPLREAPASIVSVENIVYRWQAALDMFDPAWPNPDVDLGEYFAAIGGLNSTEAYLEWMRDRPPGQMPWTMTAYAAINYIRAGFGRAPVSGEYAYDVLWGGDFEPAQGTLQPMPSPYVAGEGATDSWLARIGHNALSSQQRVEDGDHWVAVGASDDTNGTFQVIPWPGAGRYVLNFDYRSANAYVQVFGADSGDLLARDSNVRTVDELGRFKVAPSPTRWSAGTHDVELTGAYDYVVVALRRGEFDNVSLLKLPDPAE